jgi:hypothetical protein
MSFYWEKDSISKIEEDSIRGSLILEYFDKENNQIIGSCLCLS